LLSTPVDITVSELAIEAFLPADAEVNHGSLPPVNGDLAQSAVLILSRSQVW
jgi:hypothetical protein